MSFSVLHKYYGRNLNFWLGGGRKRERGRGTKREGEGEREGERRLGRALGARQLEAQVDRSLVTLLPPAAGTI